MDRLAPGFSLSELTVVLAVVSAGLFAAAPPLLELSSALRLRLAAAELTAVLRTARSLAVRDDVNVAVRFATEPSGEVSFGLYRDGDGDGVRNDDIRAGVDREPHKIESSSAQLPHLGRQSLRCRGKRGKYERA